MKNYISLSSFFQRFPDEATCRKYIARQRWGTEPACPRCGSMKVWRINDGMGFKCGDCPTGKQRFSVRTGTIMEKSRVPLQKWLLAMYIMTTARKGISSIQLAKELGVTQKTAWFLEHRIRLACNDGRVLLDVGSAGGAPALGSGGHSVAFAPGLSPASITVFPPAAHRTGRTVFPYPALQADHATRTRTASPAA